MIPPWPCPDSLPCPGPQPSQDSARRRALWPEVTDQSHCPCWLLGAAFSSARSASPFLLTCLLPHHSRLIYTGPCLASPGGHAAGPGLGLWRLALPVVSSGPKFILVPFRTSPGRCLLPRPKSLAGSSPSTRLLTLEEAQARTQGRLGTPTGSTIPKTPASPVERYAWDAREGEVAGSPGFSDYLLSLTQTPEGKEREQRNNGSQGVAVGRHSLLWGGAPAYPGRSPCPGWAAAGLHHSLQVRS